MLFGEQQKQGKMTSAIITLVTLASFTSAYLQTDSG
jgi:hypothetical protein